LHIPPYGWQEAVDVTGAGDTVAAVYATALAVGTGYRDAALLANIAGGIVVMKKGTATVSAAELQEALWHA
ncbi:MAG TPA: PfkB family carbohydrate kinase, partial [Acidobacteriota bacterium]|nr:PfkB family carbohydrate kinase [Acidobacteriota bacterium]